MVDAIANVGAILDYIERKVRSLRSRFEKASSNPAEIDKLLNTLRQVGSELHILRAECEKQQQGPVSSGIKVVQGRVSLLEAKAEEMNQKLVTIESILNKGGSWKQKLVGLQKAKSVFEYMSGAQTCAEEMRKEIVGILNCLHNILASTSVGASTSAALRTNSLLQRITDGPNVLEDSFRRSFYDVPNPSFVILRYERCIKHGREARRVETLEFQLKEKVLSQKSCTDVAAFGSPVRTGISATGMGGTGKTCALRGLATDKEVQEFFFDGIYWLSFGEQATEAGTKKQLTKIVLNTGGKQTASEMERAEYLDSAVLCARHWFKGRRILLLVDDIWAGGQIGAGAFQLLNRIVDATSGSRLVITTRDINVASDSEIVYFTTRDKDDACQMLLRAADEAGDDTKLAGNVIDSLLNICGGLPLALATVGNTIRRRCCKLQPQDRALEWSRYLAILEKCKGEMLEVSCRDHYQHVTLAASFETSLIMLEQMHEAEENAKGESRCSSQVPLRKSYRSLVLLKRQETIPVRVLFRLWNSENARKAEQIAQMFIDCSPAEQRTVIEDGVSSMGIALHDLQLNFICLSLSTKDVREVHRDLLNSWTAVRSPSEYRESGTLRCWASDCVLDDDYIRRNLYRHLNQAGLGSEMVEVLRNPRWIVKKLCKRELISLTEDFEMVFSQKKKESNINTMAGAKSNSAIERRKVTRMVDKADQKCRSLVLRREGNSLASAASDVTDLKILLLAAKSSSLTVAKNSEEAWFQLVAHLCNHTRSSERIARFVEACSNIALKPWARPISFTLPMLDERLICIIPVRGDVDKILVASEERSYHCSVRNTGSAYTCVLREGIAEDEVWMGNPGEDDDTDLMESSQCGPVVCNPSARALINWSYIRKTAISRDNSRIATGHGDGALRIWDLRTGDMLSDGRSLGESAISCLCWSTDMTRVVSGDSDGAIKLWIIHAGPMQCHHIGIHGDEVSSLVWHPHKDLVASAGGTSTVKIWKTASGKRTSWSVDLGGEDAWIYCVSWSPDGSRLATGGLHGLVRVWDEHKKQIHFSALHTDGDVVTCLSWSSDGQNIAFGGYDNWIRVRDAESGREVFAAHSGHRYGVHCIAWSSGSTQLASGSLGDVRIWNIEAENILGSFRTISRFHLPTRPSDSRRVLYTVHSAGRERGHMGSLDGLTCAQLSPDERCMATGFQDGSVRIWNISKGNKLVHCFDSAGRVTCLKWSRDGNFVAKGCVVGMLRIWDIQKGQRVGNTLRGHTGWVRCIAWSPSGNNLVSGGDDGVLNVWDVIGGHARVSGLHSGHRFGGILCIEWGINGSHVYSGGYDGARKWNVDNHQAIGDLLPCGSIFKIWPLAYGTIVAVMARSGDVSTWNVDSGRRVQYESHLPDRWVYRSGELRLLPSDKCSQTRTLATLATITEPDTSDTFLLKQIGWSKNVCIADSSSGFIRLNIVE